MTKEKVVFADVLIGEGMVRDNHFECAAWYEKILLRPGVYPLAGVINSEGEIEGVHIHSGIWFKVPGVIQSDYFASRLGSAIGSYDTKKHAGKPATWRGFVRTYDVAKGVLEGLRGIRLRPGFEARRINFLDHTGKACHTHGIFDVRHRESEENDRYQKACERGKLDV
jgi:hypothetical protein